MSRSFVTLFFGAIILIAVATRTYFYSPTSVPKNSLVTLEVVVQKVTTGESSQRLEVADIVIFAPVYPEILVGDRLVVIGKVDSEGRMLEPEVKKIGHDRGVLSTLWSLRKKIVSNVESILPPREATLVVGTVLGVDKIGRDFREDLVKTGTIHVVVVSGQNLAIVVGIFLALSKYLGRKLAMVFAVGACLFYAVLTGFEPPVVRAFLMVIITTLALFFGKVSSALVSLFLAAVTIVFVWPDSIESISFQLTFAATLGIITLGARLQGLLRVPVLGEVLAVCLGAFMTTAPVILYHFGSISILSPVINVLVSEAVFPVMILGALVSILSLVFLPAAQLLAYFVYVPAHYFVEVVMYFSKLPVGTVTAFEGNFIGVVIIYSLIFGLYVIWGKGRHERSA